MIITDSFVYLHMPRTGGNFVSSLLRANTSPAEIQNINADQVPTWMRTNGRANLYHQSISNLPKQYTHLPKFGFIRNPWDWYVSWFHYQQARYRPQKANAFFEYASSGNTLGFKETITRLLNFSNDAEGIIKKINNNVRLHNNLAIYPRDINDMVDWDLNFYSWRFFKIFSGKAEFPADDVEVLKYEKLVEDLVIVLKEHSSPTNEFIENIKNSHKVNGSTHDHYRAYYDDKLMQLVHDKDKKIINKYNYDF